MYSGMVIGHINQPSNVVLLFEVQANQCVPQRTLQGGDVSYAMTHSLPAGQYSLNISLFRHQTESNYLFTDDHAKWANINNFCLTDSSAPCPGAIYWFSPLT